MIQLTVISNNPKNLEPLQALLGLYPISGIQEEENRSLVFLEKQLFEDKSFQADLAKWTEIYQLDIQKEVLPDVNWNKEWEKNFDPVFVEDFLTIKADFHREELASKHSITINPKMSFGTGHHATTWMMAKTMQYLSFKNTKVLDAGTGTGVLAILAEQLGSENIVAFDNDPWSYENALENIAINEVTSIEVFQGSLDDVKENAFDLILANINRNFLLENVDLLKKKVKRGGLIVISGFLEQDTKKVLDCYLEKNWMAQYLIQKEKWMCITFVSK